MISKENKRIFNNLGLFNLFYILFLFSNCTSLSPTSRQDVTDEQLLNNLKYSSQRVVEFFATTDRNKSSGENYPCLFLIINEPLDIGSLESSRFSDDLLWKLSDIEIENTNSVKFIFTNDNKKSFSNNFPIDIIDQKNEKNEIVRIDTIVKRLKGIIKTSFKSPIMESGIYFYQGSISEADKYGIDDYLSDSIVNAWHLEQDKKRGLIKSDINKLVNNLINIGVSVGTPFSKNEYIDIPKGLLSAIDYSNNGTYLVEIHNGGRDLKPFYLLSTKPLMIYDADNLILEEIQIIFIGNDTYLEGKIPRETIVFKIIN